MHKHKPFLYYSLIISIMFISELLAQNGTLDSTLAEMPTTKWAHSACVVDGKLYVIGGLREGAVTFSDNYGLNKIEIYDPETDTWDTTKTPMPTARGYINTIVFDGKIYVIGGTPGYDEVNPYIALNTVEVYDPQTDTWDTTATPMITKRYEHKSCVVNGKIYVIGGITEYPEWYGMSTVEAYDPVSDTWETKKDMPTPRGSLVVCVFDGKIYAIGGIQSVGTTTLATVEVYDPVTDTWDRNAATDMPYTRSHAPGCVFNDKFYIFGGWGGTYAQNIDPPSIVMYDPLTDIWLTVYNTPPFRAQIEEKANVISHKVYLTGDWNGELPAYDHWVRTKTYTPVQEPIYANNYYTNSTYISEITGSMLLNTEFVNHHNREFTAKAMFSSFNSSHTDSVDLYDDGLHVDGTAEDGIYGNYIGNIPIESHFKIDIKTKNLYTNEDFIVTDSDYFSTVGPLVFDHCTIASSDTIPNPGDRLKFNLVLRNNSDSATATEITALIRSLDTLSTIISEELVLNFGDIAPGAAVASSNNKYIKFSDNFTGPLDTLRFALEIASQGYTFWYDTTMQVVVNLKHDQPDIPRQHVLHQNYPNPFNPKTVISYTVGATGRSPVQVELSIYNVLGQKVCTLVSEKQKTGTYEVEWDATGFASGVYLYSLQTDKEFSQTRKLVLLK